MYSRAWSIKLDFHSSIAFLGAPVAATISRTLSQAVKCRCRFGSRLPLTHLCCPAGSAGESTVHRRIILGLRFFSLRMGGPSMALRGWKLRILFSLCRIPRKWSPVFCPKDSLRRRRPWVALQKVCRCCTKSLTMYPLSGEKEDGKRISCEEIGVEFHGLFGSVELHELVA